MAQFKVGDAVCLLVDIPEAGLSKGDLGAIVLDFDTPAIAYETEFCDSEGRTIAQVALRPDQITRYDPQGVGTSAS
jgi:hypothetical protein